MKSIKDLFLILVIIAFMSLSVVQSANIKNCATYVPGDSSRCQNCTANYTLTQDRRQCVNKITNCDFASNSDPKKCATCTSPYVPANGGALCVTGITNC